MSTGPSFQAALLAAVAFIQEPSAPQIPADEASAPAALRDSPRHGEWIDVASPGGGPAIKTWVVYPQRPDKAPVVVVIHEIFGLTDWVRGVADSLAAEGFIALAPDLLSGMGPGGGGTASFQGDAVREAIGKLKGEEVARRLDAVRAAGLALPSAASKSACIGFCWGGSSSFAYARAQPGLSAAVVYYGTAPQDKEALRRIACPVLGLYGGDDARVTSTVQATATAMRELGKPFEQHVYAGAGHGFLRQQSGRDGANLKAAREGWRETIAFLQKNL
jgi:carboxymethylenebutenolidase